MLAFCANCTVSVPPAFTTIDPSIIAVAAVTAVILPMAAPRVVVRSVPTVLRADPSITVAKALNEVAVAVPPMANRTKLPAAAFAQLTGWHGRTSDHARDAAMLIWGRRVRISQA